MIAIIGILIALLRPVVSQSRAQLLTVALIDHRQEKHPAMDRGEQLENEFSGGGAVVTGGRGGE